eukprot:TRINITY_DN123869_c0_g1_i1.p1 TRINITY_DN123869_c0_g1~~TRINITY_DN123869_c0_g1_i1.p1  ORF type:complete len:572 (+),score=129.00 TRINITY_DN123869_c0_g1_i1:91-1806(+)
MPDWAGILEALKAKKQVVATVALGATAAAVSASLLLRWRTAKGRELKRPYVLRDLAIGDTVEDPEAEITAIVSFLQDALVRPLDSRLPGRPFEYDLLQFPFTPLVMIVGNHSAGKSTFINRLFGVSIQETGVAPTDDGFTVLQRHERNESEDGPTLLGCPENRPFKELQRFGPAFWRHLRRKKLLLPEDSNMPYGLQIVDTPGMIDMPAHGGGTVQPGPGQHTSSGRGYNFLKVVRWFAQRADLILLLFDPDRPGTTGESLDVLTQSLNGYDHKFLIVLNKVDQLDSSVDFARAYGTLGWALSKVIPRKDIPQIYTMYSTTDVEARGPGKSQNNNGETAATLAGDKAHKLPLEAFRRKRDEVVAEVLRTKLRHWDGVITSTEEIMRQLAMVCTVTNAVRERVVSRRTELQVSALALVALPGALVGALLGVPGRSQFNLPKWVVPTFWTAFTGICYGAGHFVSEYLKQFEKLQLMNLDEYFEKAYAGFFIHADAEDLRARWGTVKSMTASILTAVSSVRLLPAIHHWEVERINYALDKDLEYARQLARYQRATPEMLNLAAKFDVAKIKAER